MRVIKGYKLDSLIINEFPKYKTFTSNNKDFIVNVYNGKDGVEILTPSVNPQGDPNALTNVSHDYITIKSVDKVIDMKVMINDSQFAIDLKIDDKQIFDESLVQESVTIFDKYYMFVRDSMKKLESSDREILREYIGK